MSGERTLPGLGLTGFWNLGSDGWKTGADNNWRLLSAAVQLRALSRVTALPMSPTDGDIYIVPAGDSMEGAVAVRDNGVWVFIEPQTGWIAWVEDDEEHVRFNDGAWAVLVPGGSDNPLDLAVSISGEMDSDEVVLNFVAVRSFTIADDFSGSEGYAATTAATDLDLDVQKNGVSVGTIHFESSTNEATFSTSGGGLSFTAGDRLQIIGPTYPDTWADISITLKGSRV